MIVTTADLYQIAYGKFAIGAYNINNMEQALGLFEGHVKGQAPFIIQLSKGARKYAGVKMLEAILRDHPENFDFRKPGEAFIKAYADFIAHKSQKLQSAGKLTEVRAALAGVIA